MSRSPRTRCSAASASRANGKLRSTAKRPGGLGGSTRAARKSPQFGGASGTAWKPLLRARRGSLRKTDRVLGIDRDEGVLSHARGSGVEPLLERVDRVRFPQAGCYRPVLGREELTQLEIRSAASSNLRGIH